jgi:hypothetical protein
MAGSRRTGSSVELPAQTTASTKRFRLKEVDPTFGDADGIYWSPKGSLVMAEDGSNGRLLRMTLDNDGNSDRQMTERAVADESLRNQLNSIPPLPLTASSMAQFSGIVPHGFYHVLDADTPQRFGCTGRAQWQGAVLGKLAASSSLVRRHLSAFARQGHAAAPRRRRAGPG